MMLTHSAPHSPRSAWGPQNSASGTQLGRAGPLHPRYVRKPEVCGPLGAAPRDGHAGELVEEALVVALLQLAFDLFHRVQADADHDEQAGAAEHEVLATPRPPKAMTGRIAMSAR